MCCVVLCCCVAATEEGMDGMNDQKINVLDAFIDARGLCVCAMDPCDAFCERGVTGEW